MSWISQDSVAQGDIEDVAGAQGLGAVVAVRDERKRPRTEAEVQPVQMGRQRPVGSVQHGETLTAATLGGRRSEADAECISPGHMPGKQ